MRVMLRRGSGASTAPPQKALLVAGPDAVPAPSGSGVNALRLPAVGPVVIIAVVIKERAHHAEPVGVVMVKVVMSKSLPVKFASDAATASRAHMAFGKTSADATAAAMGGKASAAKAAGMAATPKTTAAVAAAAHATTAATAKAPATSTTSASTAASKRIASDPSACQCQRGNESRN